jgi:hypothetical protein
MMIVMTTTMMVMVSFKSAVTTKKRTAAAPSLTRNQMTLKTKPVMKQTTMTIFGLARHGRRLVVVAGVAVVVEEVKVGVAPRPVCCLLRTTSPLNHRALSPPAMTFCARRWPAQLCDRLFMRKRVPHSRLAEFLDQQTVWTQIIGFCNFDVCAQINAAPDCLPCREVEHDEISQFVRQGLIRGNSPASLYIAGMPGTAISFHFSSEALEDHYRFYLFRNW